MADNSDNEWYAQLKKNYERNKKYATTANYFTVLPAPQELQFRQWLQQNKVPFDPNSQVSDYDMRGFYQALLNKDPRALTGIDPNDHKLHYPDVWKTPYHETFSADSQWAMPNAPKWNDKDQLIDMNGRILFDDVKANQK